MAPPNIYEAFEKLGQLRLERLVYRHISPDRDCRSGEGARAFGGRWNPARSFPALYTALSPETAYLELARRAAIQKVDVVQLLPRTLCVLNVRLSRVLDLSTEIALDLVGLDASAIESVDASLCQTVGEAAHRLGFEAILAPSATQAGLNLVAFPLNLLADSEIKEQDALIWRRAADLPLR